MQIFNFNGAQVRTVEKSGETWFVLKDVCGVLEVDQTAGIKRRLTDDVISNHLIPDSFGRNQETTIINEDGLYDVILESRKPEAKAFRKWVTRDVLPSIRKTGNYSTNQVPAAAPVQQVDLKDIDQVVKMVQLLRIGLKDGLLDDQSGQALRRQIAERIIGQKNGGLSPLKIQESVTAELPQIAEYTGRWYLTKEIAVIAGVNINLISRLASRHKLQHRCIALSV